MVSRAEFDPLGLAGREGEGERVEDQLVRLDRVVVAGEVVDPPGDGELSLRGAGHALLVDRERDDARAVIAHVRQHGVAAEASVLQVDAVDDPATGVHLEGSLDHIGVRAVDDERRVDAHLQRLHDRAHLVGLVAALGDRHAHVEGVRATLDLGARDPEHTVVVVREEEALHRA